MPACINVRHPCPPMELAIALALLASGAAQAQSGGDVAGPAEGKDPSVVITRTVQPRIAYRGVPVEDNPIHAEATTFPAGVFHRALGEMMGELVGEDALGQHGSAGLAGQGAAQGLAADSRLLGSASMFGPTASGSARVPAGQGAAVGGAVSGATSGIAGAITGAMQMLAPAIDTQDSGP